MSYNKRDIISFIMLRSILSFEREDYKALVASFFIAALLFVGSYAEYAYSEAVTLSVTISSSLTLTSTSDQFGTLTPGTFKIATTTLAVTTNNTDGYNVTLSGDDQSPTNTVMDLTTDASVGLADQTEWVPGGGTSPATTTAGNGVLRASLDSSGQVLAFRVYSSSTPAFYASSWWGANDSAAAAKWAGIASSTIARRIGNVQSKGGGNTVYNSAKQRITVAYYLDVPSSQQQGSYTGGLTYTATAN